MRLPPAEPDAYYHVYNRGVDKRKVFYRRGEYLRFIRTMRNILTTGSATERSPKIQSLTLNSLTLNSYNPDVAIICYCLMPNHFHLLIKQDSEEGISHFMQQLDTSYTKYFNLNHKRKGRLFEHSYKAKKIESDNMLMHVSRYIHLNPLIAGLTDTLSSYAWSSYPEFIGKRPGTLPKKEEILGFFKHDPVKYETFVHDQIEYALLLDRIKHAEAMDEDENSLFL